jgi:hypothetical protein
MNLTELDTLVDLEMTLSLTPLCEDDHTDVSNTVVCECSTYAVARMVWTCEDRHILVCQRLVDWALQPPLLVCGDHGLPHIKIHRL